LHSWRKYKTTSPNINNSLAANIKSTPPANHQAFQAIQKQWDYFHDRGYRNDRKIVKVI
jgi:hypothetical protein